MKLSKRDWLLVLFGITILISVIANELGYGICVFPPMALLGYWLIEKAFLEDKKIGN
jgi:hypothetical protein